MVGMCTPFQTFLISDFVLQDTKKDFFDSVIKIISDIYG